MRTGVPPGTPCVFDRENLRGGDMSIKTDDQYGREFSAWLRRLLAGSAPDEGTTPAQFGRYAEYAEALLDAYKAGNTPAVQATFDALAVGAPELFVLASSSLERGKDKKGLPSLGKFRPLDGAMPLTDELVRRACPWLADYIMFSRRWSPRAYEGFHPACGIWLLSTVAAGRVTSHFGGLRKTPVSIALTARSSLHAKSTTARVAQQVLEESGLDWLLFGEDEATPQRFIQSLAGKLPENFEKMAGPAQQQARREFAFSGQRGWYYDEFGQLVAQITRQNGYMGEFRSILRWMDDSKRSHRGGTIGRGTDEILNPYLALLCNMTPADLKASARRGAGMWGDGFWARFAFVCPPADKIVRKDRIPSGRREVPETLTEPLQDWHIRLGEPEVAISPVLDKKGEPTGEMAVERIGPLPESELFIGNVVYEAFYAYSDALLDQVAASDSDDLSGNYVRFAEKALRLAMLFASLKGSEEIALEHFALGQAITETWRENLHSLFEQVNEPEPGFDEQVEAKILKLVEKFAARGQMITMRMVGQYVYGADTEKKGRMVAAMCKANILEKIAVGKTEYYRFPVEVEAPIEVEGDLVPI